MTWQLASFSILFLALAGGFAWYERTRPDARIVALVATLAAFAALGRIAFAAVPNVKPTTDIVLISGYALGGGPGFVVGALAGLTSNFFFGQGPWTPWQMAAWGATGLIGAGLAALTRRTLGRWSLALVCGVVGFAFTAVQDVGDWVTYSDHSAAQLRVYVGKGIGFDLVHAVGCVLFALAFGPALARSVARFAARVKVTWRPPTGAAAATVIAALTLATGLTAAIHTQSASGAASPTTYLLSAQNADGGFGASPGASSSQLFSGWAALGLAAEGLNLQGVRHGGPSLITYISAGAPTDVGSLERTILVVRAAGLPATSQLAALKRDIRGDGSVSDQVNLTSFAILALRAAGTTPPRNMTAWLARQQDSDGGFNFATAGGTSDVDDTGAALEALTGGSGGTISRAVAFLRHQQNGDGGFPSNPGEDSNAQSTAWAIQGLLAAGASPDARGGRDPINSANAYLRSLIAADGHVRYSRSADQTPVWVTAQAAMALAGKPLPFPAPPAASAGAAGNATGGRSAPGSRQPRARHAGSGHEAKAVQHRRHAGPREASDGLEPFASDVGVVVALVLAPIGQ
jgi:energy-coupling factor transport system substrate-specific component